MTDSPPRRRRRQQRAAGDDVSKAALPLDGSEPFELDQKDEARTRPGWTGSEVFRYLLQWPDGSSAGRATYDVPIRLGDVIFPSYGPDARWLRVREVSVIEDPRFDGVLTVEPV